MLAPRPVDALGRATPAGRCQIASAGLGRIDHVVDLRVAGRDVRVDVRADLLGQLERAWRRAPSPSGIASSCLRWMMLTAPSGPITAISAVGHATM